MASCGAPKTGGISHKGGVIAAAAGRARDATSDPARRGAAGSTASLDVAALTAEAVPQPLQLGARRRRRAVAGRREGDPHGYQLLAVGGSSRFEGGGGMGGRERTVWFRFQMQSDLRRLHRGWCAS